MISRMLCRILWVVLMLFSALAIPQQSAQADVVTWYVDWVAYSGGNNGTTWVDAFRNLQDAIAAASAGDQIWVADGVYNPAYQSTDVNATFTLKNGVAMYGGFAGGETDLNQRSWHKYRSILSGDVDWNDTRVNYITQNWQDIAGDNSYHVVTVGSAASTTILDGFVITGGQADGAGDLAHGGGITMSVLSQPTLRNLLFIGNYAASHGGAMNIQAGTPALSNSIFVGNKGGQGGGIYINLQAPVMTNLLFNSNQATDGAAIYVDASGPTLVNATFYNNSASSSGGAVTNQGGAVVLKNSILWQSSPQHVVNTSGAMNIRYSIVQGGCPAGVGCTAVLNADPLFQDAPGWDDIAGTLDDNLHLQEASPAIDAGENAATAYTKDLDGKPRKSDLPQKADTGSGTAPVIDMGPYEARIIYVDADAATGAKNGTNWEDAYTDLQAALADAAPGNQIWAAEAVYLPGDDAGDTFNLVPGVTLLGGFAATEATPAQRNISAHPTILSGDLAGDDTNTDGNQIAETWADLQGTNAQHVILAMNLGRAVILDGVVITAGDFVYSATPRGGGGIYAEHTALTLRNTALSGNRNTVNTNTFVAFGGGMYAISCRTITLENTTFTGNLATSPISSARGGGLALGYQTVLNAEMVTFSANAAIGAYDSYGGGIYTLENNTIQLHNSLFDSNLVQDTADHYAFGGGLFTAYNAVATITNTTFHNNAAHSTSTAYGGGMYIRQSTLTMENVTFDQNHAVGGDSGEGGGLHLNNVVTSLTTSTFSGNTVHATYGTGAGIHQYAGTLYAQAVDFVENSITAGAQESASGGGMYSRQGVVSLYSLNFTGNTLSGGSGYGGGLYILNGLTTDSSVLVGLRFTDNQINAAECLGGGLRLEVRGTPVTLLNTRFYGNRLQCTSRANGGGLYVDTQPDMQFELVQSIFSGNSASAPDQANGGGAYIGGYGARRVLQSVFSHNQATLGGGMYWGYSENTSIVANSILWNNSAADLSGTVQVYNSLTEDWSGAGDAYLNADPSFVDADGADDVFGTPDDDLHITYASPAIQHGSNAYLPGWLGTDLDGSPRLIGGIVEMGAYEMDSAYDIFLPLLTH